MIPSSLRRRISLSPFTDKRLAGSAGFKASLKVRFLGPDIILSISKDLRTELSSLAGTAAAGASVAIEAALSSTAAAAASTGTS